jgi:hypothetical protein
VYRHKASSVHAAVACRYFAPLLRCLALLLLRTDAAHFCCALLLHAGIVLLLSQAGVAAVAAVVCAGVVQRGESCCLSCSTYDSQQNHQGAGITWWCVMRNVPTYIGTVHAKTTCHHHAVCAQQQCEGTWQYASGPSTTSKGAFHVWSATGMCGEQSNGHVAHHRCEWGDEVVHTVCFV